MFWDKMFQISDKKSFKLCQVFMHDFSCQNEKINKTIFGLYQVFVFNFLWKNSNSSELYTADAH